MICLTIEFKDQEWFIDRDTDELRRVDDPSIVRKFASLDAEELAEIAEAIDYRQSEIGDLFQIFEELQFPESYGNTPKPKTGWGK